MIEIHVNFQQFSNGSDSFSACLFNGQIEIDLFTLHVLFSKCNVIILQRIVSLKFYLIYVDMYALFMKDKGGNPLKPYKLKRSIITARSMTS